MGESDEGESKDNDDQLDNMSYVIFPAFLSIATAPAVHLEMTEKREPENNVPEIGKPEYIYMSGSSGTSIQELHLDFNFQPGPKPLEQDYSMLTWKEGD